MPRRRNKLSIRRKISVQNEEVETSLNDAITNPITDHNRSVDTQVN